MRHQTCIQSAILLSVVVLNTFALRADDELKTRPEVTQTDTVDFPPGSVLRLSNSIGDVTVTGWDRPQLEVTAVKSKKSLYDARKREKALQDLAKVQIKTERSGNDVVITTKYPGYRFFPPNPLRGRHDDLELEYRISAPRDARLVIDHDKGEVHIDDVASDLRIHVRSGAITVRLPEDDQSAIDAKTLIGRIYSDFPGQPSQVVHSLHLRTGFGDISIVKIRKPPYGQILANIGGR
jgi:hypothetical protein